VVVLLVAMVVDWCCGRWLCGGSSSKRCGDALKAAWSMFLFFFLCDFPLFSSTPLCFSVFLPFYSSFFFPSLSLFPLFIFLFVSLMF
jgi:hypothetical protein